MDLKEVKLKINKINSIGTFYEEVFQIIKDHHENELKATGLDLHFISDQASIREDIKILISGQYKEETEKQFPNLKMIIVPYTGLNGIDLELAKKNNLVIKNSSAHGKFVAERALALILTVLGKIVYYHNNLIRGDWSKRTESDRVDWKTLSKKRVAIYGYGVIGKRLHDYMKAFDVEVGVLNYKNRLYENVTLFQSLEELAKWCDILVIAAPLNDETKASIDKKILEKLKSSILINVARGPIVVEDDLYEALKSNTLEGFGSDVWYQYPNKDQKNIMPSKYPLESFENVVMTPHCGGFEETSLSLRCQDVVEQIIEYSKSYLI